MMKKSTSCNCKALLQKVLSHEGKDSEQSQSTIKIMEQVSKILLQNDERLPKCDFLHHNNNLEDEHLLSRLRQAAIALLSTSEKKSKKKWNVLLKSSENQLKRKSKDYPQTSKHSEMVYSRVQNAEKWQKVYSNETNFPLASADSCEISFDPITVPEPTRLKCYICHSLIGTKTHLFYSRMCHTCGSFNLQKRNQSADLSGKKALLTGGRVKIGYETALKLLCCNCSLVIVTTRFPQDAAKRFSNEADFTDWRERLHIYPLDLRLLGDVESFCDFISCEYDRLDILIQNAAQTVRRPTAFYSHLISGETQSDINSQFLVRSWEKKIEIKCTSSNLKYKHCEDSSKSLLTTQSLDKNEEMKNYNNIESCSSLLPVPKSVALSQLHLHPEDFKYQNLDLLQKHFPPNKYDEFHQQLDLRPLNSWVLETDHVDTTELVEVNLINFVSPFVILSKLTELLKRNKEKEYSWVILVSAMEGKFNRPKTSQHPHTNCAKASLNMLAKTSAQYYRKFRVLLNAVDTGWVTDEDPLNFSRKTKNYDKNLPLDCVDGAARILDPIFQTINENVAESGNFLKDYKTSTW